MKKATILAWLVVLLTGTSFAFQMNSGYYVGNGAGRSITGVGFQPDLVIIVPEIGSVPAVFKTSSMPIASGTAFFPSSTANFAGGVTSLDSDGFTVGSSTSVNTVNTRYSWIAFGGSGGGDLKVGSYPGNGLDNRDIDGVGFQPDLVFIKRNSSLTNSQGCWRSSAMPGDTTEYFHNANTPGANLIQSLGADGFQVGTDAHVNNNTDTYYYVAFKNVAGKMAVGSYAGDGLDNKSISLGFKPDLVWTKGDTNTAAQYGVLRLDKSYGDSTQPFLGTIAINCLQSLEADGFQVGTDVRVNEDTRTYYYAAFTGVPTPAAAAGNFRMASGSYAGASSGQTISGLGFRPNLVIIKGGGTQNSVFATSDMPDGYYAYFTTNGLVASGGITLSSEGFSVGTNANVNAVGTTFYWTAYGNAGSANFMVGAYTGNGEDNRNITGLGFQPDMVTVKKASTGLAYWSSSAMGADNTAAFLAVDPGADYLQAFPSGGFQVGTNTNVNAIGLTFFYFAFKQTPGYFKVGSYTGNGTTQSIGSLGGRPSPVWVKNSSVARNGVTRDVNLGSGDIAQSLAAASNLTNRITALNAAGFDLGSDADVNSGGTTYWYAAWLSNPASVEFSVQPTGPVVNSAITPPFVVRVVDQYGRVVDSDSSTSVTVSLSSNPGSATLTGTVSATVNSGVATFEGIKLDKVGTGYVLQAAASGLATGYSNSFNVGSASADYLVFTTQPSTAAASSVLTPAVQVAVKDSYGNTVTGDNSSQITLALANSGGATLGGTLTKTASSGVASFSDLTVNLRGTGYKLTATASSLTGATSEGFDITAESTAPTVVSLTPSGEGASRETTVTVRFSEAMDQSAVERALSVKAVRDNQGNSLDTAVTGSYAWPSPETVVFTPGASLESNYTYQVTVTTEARDAVGNPLAATFEATFTTLSSTGGANTFLGDDGKTRLVVPAGALDVAFSVRIAVSPESSPIVVDPAAITAADAKVSAEGNAFTYILGGSAREFVFYDSSGARFAPQFSSGVTLTLPYTDADGDGLIDGASPPARVDSVRICRLDETHRLWIIYPSATVDQTARTVSTSVRSLSTYALIARPATGVGAVHVFPNPFQPSLGQTTVTFTDLPSQCTIIIFTATGMPVRTISESSGTGQNVWDVKNDAGEPLASGLYIYLIKSAGETKKGKLVVIR